MGTIIDSYRVAVRPEWDHVCKAPSSGLLSVNDEGDDSQPMFLTTALLSTHLSIPLPQQSFT